VTLQAQQFAIDGDFLAAVNLVARFGGLAVDADAPLLQHRVELAPRANALVGEKLLNSFHRAIIQLRRIKARESSNGLCHPDTSDRRGSRVLERMASLQDSRLRGNDRKNLLALYNMPSLQDPDSRPG
jgi:hypothetical protein